MIDLSADLGEGSAGEDEVWPLISSANVACGGHAGDDESMRAAVALAFRYHVHLGAHPSYPDREGFGRRRLSMPAAELRDSLTAQLARLRDIGSAAGVPLRHVKPHGALYNDAHSDPSLAFTIVEAILHVDPSLAVVCGDSSALAAAARECNLRVIREAFGDRRYAADGSLVARGKKGALLDDDEAAAQARLLATEGCVVTEDATRLQLPFDTICIHADSEGAAERLRAIRAALVDT